MPLSIEKLPQCRGSSPAWPASAHHETKEPTPSTDTNTARSQQRPGPKSILGEKDAGLTEFRPAEIHQVQGTEGVGEIAEARTQAAAHPPVARHGIAPLSFPGP